MSQQHNEKERRFLPMGSAEIVKRNDEPEKMIVSGYAAIFDSVYDLGWFRETVRKGAFDDADMSDIVALLNHDDNIVIGRTTAGTLRVEVDDTGLKYEIELPNSPNGVNVYEAIKRGDLTQSSWAFTVARQAWNEPKGEEITELREILGVSKIYDVSPVTYPANPDTTVAKRAQPKKNEKQTNNTSIYELELFLLQQNFQNDN